MSPAAGLLALGEILAATEGTLAAPGPATVQVTSVSIDSRTLEPGALFVAIKGPRFDGHDFVAQAAARGAQLAVVAREVSPSPEFPQVRVADTTRALADLAAHVRSRSSVPIVGITGSVGKTTTKDMTAQLLASRGPVLKTEGNLNNQYGLPLTLLRLRPEHTAAVIEIGMSAPGEIRALSRLVRPGVATITRIAPVHLEFFPSIDAIAKAKAEILEDLPPSATAVLNADDPRVRAIGERFPGRVVWFGRERECEVSAAHEQPTSQGTELLLTVAGRAVPCTLPLRGPHFVVDFLAAAAAAHVLGTAPESIAETARAFRPAPHRGEVRTLRHDVVLLDDCYNSSPDALEVAVVALGQLPGRRRVAILGDMLELGSTGPTLHRERGRALAGRVDLVIGVGQLAREIVAGARDGGVPSQALHHFPDATAAARAAVDMIHAGDAVLVKASRAVALEVVVTALVDHFGEGKA